MNSKNDPFVSVAICTHNNSETIEECVKSILKQTYKKFELILVNDNSTDKTHKIISKIKDKRIRYFKLDDGTGSISKSRNYSIHKAKGEYIFITDGDCVANKDWISQGISFFNKNKCLAFEGKIIYHKQNYKPTVCDRNIHNVTGKKYMTANMAYKKTLFNNITFDPCYDGAEDRAVALQILKETDIPFNSYSEITHKKIERHYSSMFKESERVRSKVKLMKDFKDYTGSKMRILYPKHFLLMIFPPLIIYEFLTGRVKSKKDLYLLPGIYFNSVYLRFLIWITAIKEKVFIL